MTQDGDKPIFTRRHYQYIAEHMASVREQFTYDVWITHIMQFGAIFKKDNPSFVIVRFMQACGLSRGAANRALDGDVHPLT